MKLKNYKRFAVCFSEVKIFLNELNKLLLFSFVKFAMYV